MAGWILLSHPGIEVLSVGLCGGSLNVDGDELPDGEKKATLPPAWVRNRLMYLGQAPSSDA